MAWFALARVLFVAAVAYSAAILLPLPVGLPANVGFALALAALVVLFESRLRETAVTRVLGALIGCAIGLAIAHAIGTGLFWADSGDRRVEFLHSFVLIVLPYLGLVLGGQHGEWLEPPRLVSLFRATGPERRYKILDTSVIIDGRIADVCETGFVDGTLVIPQFVLKELQLVADSADSLKRNRGRRGLDILQRLQKMSVVDNARKMISRTIEIVVTSVLQTTAGKMIFGRYIEAGVSAQAAAAAAPERVRAAAPVVPAT